MEDRSRYIFVLFSKLFENFSSLKSISAQKRGTTSCFRVCIRIGRGWHLTLLSYYLFNSTLLPFLFSLPPAPAMGEVTKQSCVYCQAPRTRSQTNVGPQLSVQRCLSQRPSPSLSKLKQGCFSYSLQCSPFSCFLFSY